MAGDMKPTRVGVVGTGFIARHVILELAYRPAYALGRVLTRRPLASCADFPHAEKLTNSLEALIESSDLVFECTGDVLHATDTVAAAHAAGKPVVTLNPEFHVTTGSAFVETGFLTEADGDQPGCQASLYEEAVALGFTPLVLGNMKGFLNRTPSPDDMKFWAAKQGISFQMVTSFTDGTKMQFEQALCANHFGFGIAKDELVGPVTDDIKEASRILGEAATAHGGPIVDYVLSGKLPHGVFVVGTHKEEQKDALRYIKLGDGPYYTLIRNNIFVHLEVFKTFDRVIRDRSVLLANAAVPSVGIASVAKREIEPGTLVDRGCGSFDMRGICVRLAEHPGHLPIGLADNVRFKHRVEPGQMITFDDIEIPESTALTAWRGIEARVLATAKAA